MITIWLIAVAQLYAENEKKDLTKQLETQKEQIQKLQGMFVSII